MASDHPTKLNLWKGRLLALGAAVLWSTSGFFAKAPIFENWPSENRGLLLAFWRAAFASIILVTLVRRPRLTWKLIPMVLVFALMNWTFLTALVQCESTVAIWLQYTSPAWVFLISWKFFKDVPKQADWWLLASAVVGLAVIFSAELGGTSVRGTFYGLGSGFCFAAVVILLRYLRDYDAAWLIFLNHLITACLFAPIYLRSEFSPTSTQYVYLAIFGIFQMGLPYVLFAKSVQYISSHEASGITLLEPLLVPVWVYVAWHGSPEYQFPTWTTLLGAAVIFSGLAIRYGFDWYHASVSRLDRKDS
ncbi:MAG: DMT family transporter [Planctomycetota bacterium]